ncbi:putative inactive receptor-like protein kinase At3g56050 [Silene latifolia]|uniref:putative inactive receptor-like protein kinase At3g56050 n=1 Tax=Silene latifolia TaxID=37657 RepID=UPI003D7752C0
MIGGLLLQPNKLIENSRGRRRRRKMKVLVVIFIILPLFIIGSSSSLDTDTQGRALLKLKERVVTDPFNALSDWTLKDGFANPCSWSRVHCSDDANVVVLDLKDLCLVGTLPPELGQLSYIKSIILRNNTFNGLIPTQLANLPQLEVLDLGYNNFSGPLPSNLGNNFSLSILLVDNNNLIGTLSPELHQLQLLSQHQVDENHLRGVLDGISCNTQPDSWYNTQPKVFIRRSLLRVPPVSNPSETTIKGNIKREPHMASRHPRHLHKPASKSPSPSPTFAPSPSNAPVPAPAPAAAPFLRAAISPTSARVTLPSSVSSKTPEASSSKHLKVIISASIAGAFALLIIIVAVVLICRSSKVVTVRPWATGISGQLQRAFVSGVPNLKRPELEIACEEFSNIIGSLEDGTVYKGTLSSGVEIAVVASSVKSSDEWSKKLELQFRKKMETLSKVNHKNFVNLIGYCEEEKPFTRMMVFEYAPNGTLFEHLHIKEAERLDWAMRVRIVMGMAYCLEHMHQLNSPISHRDMQSSSVYLSEDYAAKISDFSFWSVGSKSKMRSPSMQLLEASATDIESNVFHFGVVLFEIITGRIPYMEDDSCVADWVLEMLEKGDIPRQSIDPTLSWFQQDQVQTLCHIIRDCVNPDAAERPTMRQVTARLREMTGMSPDAATPKLSPLWWAELEILSTEAL